MTRKARFQLIECSVEYCRRKARSESTTVVAKLSAYATSRATRQPSGPTAIPGTDDDNDEGTDSGGDEASGSQSGAVVCCIRSLHRERKTLKSNRFVLCIFLCTKEMEKSMKKEPSAAATRRVQTYGAPH